MDASLTAYLPYVLLASVLLYILYTSITGGGIGGSATNKKEDEVITDLVYFDIQIGKEKAGKITMGLFGKTVPRTVNNFKHLCIGDKTLNNVKLQYKGTKFHRIIPGFMIQGDLSSNKAMPMMC